MNGKNCDGDSTFEERTEKKENPTDTTTNDKDTKDSAETDKVLEYLFGDASDDDEDVHPLPQDPCAYIDESKAGGGRGVFARDDLPPGVLVTAEIPYLTSTTGVFDSPEYILSAILACLGSSESVNVVKHLHPVSLSAADTEEIQSAKELLTEDITRARLAQYPSVESDEVVRILLVFQHNFFSSGLYRYLTMYNHSCEPNCIKFTPFNSSRGASEIWTIKPVQKGEELAICYCTKEEMTVGYMQSYLKSHHRFDCSCMRCTLLSRNRDGRSCTAEVPSLMPCPIDWSKLEAFLEVELESLEAEVDNKYNGSDGDMTISLFSVLATANQMLDIIFSSGVSSGVEHITISADLETKQVDKAAPTWANCLSSDGYSLPCGYENVRMQARVHKVAANAASECFNELAKRTSRSASKPQFDFALTEFLKHSLFLLEKQSMYLGSDHPFVGSTHTDIVIALEEILRSNPQYFSTLSDHWAVKRTDVRTKIAYHSAEEKRIKAMYATNARYPTAASILTSPGATFWGGMPRWIL